MLQIDNNTSLQDSPCATSPRQTKTNNVRACSRPVEIDAGSTAKRKTTPVFFPPPFLPCPTVPSASPSRLRRSPFLRKSTHVPPSPPTMRAARLWTRRHRAGPFVTSPPSSVSTTTTARRWSVPRGVGPGPGDSQQGMPGPMTRLRAAAAAAALRTDGGGAERGGCEAHADGTM